MYSKWQKYIIAILSFALILYFFLAVAVFTINSEFFISNLEKITDAFLPAKEQIMVRGTVIDTVENGVKIELDSSSKYGGIVIFLQNDENIPKLLVNDVVDIYYNGVVVDSTPICLQKVYKAERVDKSELIRN